MLGQTGWRHNFRGTLGGEVSRASSERWREQGLADLARAAVLDAADRLGRRLVLMVENLQALGANADPDFGWQLRGVLQTEPRVMLLGSGTSRFEGLDDPGEPYLRAVPDRGPETARDGPVPPPVGGRRGRPPKRTRHPAAGDPDGGQPEGCS